MKQILLFVVLIISQAKALGQCVIYQEKDGQVYTTCDVYTTGGVGSVGGGSATHNKVSYLGSQFLHFPVWQTGTVLLDKKGKDISCELAYNLVSNEVLCRFPGDSTVKTITPEEFTVGGSTFIRQSGNLAGAPYQSYFTRLTDGRTTLVMSMSKKLIPATPIKNGYTKELSIVGRYEMSKNYLIQKGNAQPEFVNLTKKSLLDVLYEQADKIAPRLTDKKLSEQEITKTLLYYDSLQAIARTSRPPLSNDELFSQVLHNTITYPGSAWNQAIYCRVYAGFEVTPAGDIKDVTILSPENAGFSFAESVKQVLEKMPRLASSLTGLYVLPVAFTYRNTKETAGTHSPINHLPENRMGNRTLLAEAVIAIAVTKPVMTSREVWGYYE